MINTVSALAALSAIRGELFVGKLVGSLTLPIVVRVGRSLVEVSSFARDRSRPRGGTFTPPRGLGASSDITRVSHAPRLLIVMPWYD